MNNTNTTNGHRETGHGTRYDTGSVVAVSTNGHAAAWCDGVFTADPEVTAVIDRAVAHREIVDVARTLIEAADDTPEGALAAMAAYSPGRVVITHAPQRVLDLLDDPEHGQFLASNADV